MGCAQIQPEVAQYPIKRLPSGFPWKIWERACGTGSVLGVLSRTTGSYNLIIFYELALSLVICPFPAILFSWGAPSIITHPFFRLFSDMFEVLCSTPRVFSITSVFSLVFLLNNLRVIGSYIRSWKRPGDLPRVIEILCLFAREKTQQILSRVEDHPGFPNNANKYLFLP